MEFPKVEIVISSSWRLDFEYEHECIPQMRKNFSFELAPRVVGVTPDHRYDDRDKAPEGLGQYQRHWECVDWLTANRPAVTPWLAIDDRPFWFHPDCANLMTIENHEVGFTEDHQDVPRTRLKALRQLDGARDR